MITYLNFSKNRMQLQKKAIEDFMAMLFLIIGILNNSFFFTHFHVNLCKVVLKSQHLYFSFSAAKYINNDEKNYAYILLVCVSQ